MIRHLIFISILSTLQQFLPARGCSDVALTNTSLFDAIISARNYDFFAENALAIQFSIMPAGSDITYTPTLNCGSPSGLSATHARSKYGFICATIARAEMVKLFESKCEAKEHNGFVGVCAEGFNTAGLSVGALTEQSQPFPPNATAAAGQKPGLYFNDVPTFLLATFGTVAEIKSSFTPATFRVVNNHGLYSDLFKLSPVGATRINHFALHDATGASAVIEFTRKGAEFAWEVMDNSLGVLTNSPDYRTQVRHAEAFMQQQVEKYGVNGRVMTPGFCGVGWNMTSYLNNNCNSMSRFTTLAMLKRNVANTAFPNPAFRESPASIPDPAQQAIIQALRLLDSVKIPGHWPDLGPIGAAPKNQVLGPQEMTIMQFVKDHRRLVWYVRTAANEQWARVDLTSLFTVPPIGEKAQPQQGTSSRVSSPVRKPVHRNVGDVLGPTRQWANDITTVVS